MIGRRRSVHGLQFEFENYALMNRNEIGEGSFGIVYQAIKKSDGEIVACKIVKQNNRQSNYDMDSQKEILALMRVSGKNIIKMHDILQENDNLFIFMEYSKHGDLGKYLKSIKYSQSINNTIYLFKQIVNGCKELGQYNIIHRDLKLENILMFDKVVKIADFGTAIVHYEEINLNLSSQGTVGFQSPQIIQSYESNGYYYSSKTDIFSLGVILYYMIYGEFPWKCRVDYIHDLIKEFKKIKDMGGIRKYIQFKPYQNNLILSKDIQECIISMLEIEEKDRISINELENHKIFDKLQKTKRNILQYSMMRLDSEVDDDVWKQKILQDSFSTLNNNSPLNDQSQQQLLEESFVQEFSQSGMKEIQKIQNQNSSIKKKKYLIKFIQHSLGFSMVCWNTFLLVDECTRYFIIHELSETKINLLKLYLKKFQIITLDNLLNSLNDYKSLNYFLQQMIESNQDYEKIKKSQDIQIWKDKILKHLMKANTEYENISQYHLNELEEISYLSDNQNMFKALLLTSQSYLEDYIGYYTTIFDQCILPIIQDIVLKPQESIPNIFIKTLYSLSQLYIQIKELEDYNSDFTNLKSTIEQNKAHFFFSQLQLFVNEEQYN